MYKIFNNFTYAVTWFLHFLFYSVYYKYDASSNTYTGLLTERLFYEGPS